MVTILHLITGLETGGAEGMLARLVTRTDRSRFRSVVVTMTDKGTVGPSIAGAGIPVEALGIRRGMIDPRGVTRVIGLLRRYRPDIVQTWLYHADLLGLIADGLGYAPRLAWNIRCSDMAGASVVRAILSRFSALPDIVFLLLGAGIDRANRDLVRVIEAHGLMPRLRLLGERTEMNAVYPALDIATLTSAFGEGFPNVLAEAMACGVPCVATDSGDSAEILGEFGIIVPPRDPQALAEGWRRMIALGDDGRRALGLRAR